VVRMAVLPAQGQKRVEVDAIGRRLLIRLHTSPPSRSVGLDRSQTFIETNSREPRWKSTANGTGGPPVEKTQALPDNPVLARAGPGSFRVREQEADQQDRSSAVWNASDTWESDRAPTSSNKRIV